MELGNDGLDWGFRGRYVNRLGVEVHRIQSSQTTLGKETQRGLSVTRILRILLFTVICLLAEVAFARPYDFTGSTPRRCTSGDAGNGGHVILGERTLALTALMRWTNLEASFSKEF
jgi:hypothetical protein